VGVLGADISAARVQDAMVGPRRNTLFALLGLLPLIRFVALLADGANHRRVGAGFAAPRCRTRRTPHPVPGELRLPRWMAVRPG
jgi:hypothetical protein